MSSVSSLSDNSGEAKGWTSQIFFYPESDKSDGKRYEFTDHELPTKITEFGNPDEKILTVGLYKVPLCEKQWILGLMNHQFIVFETEQYWWSIEKNSEGLTIQRSKKRDAVLRRYRNKKRLNGTYWDVQCAGKDKGNRTMGQLIDWLWETNHLNKRYDWLVFNCKQFARHVFNEIAKRKTVFMGLAWDNTLRELNRFITPLRPILYTIH